MGRLFWKFFAAMMLAQTVAMIGVGTAFWLMRDNQQFHDRHSLPPQFGDRPPPQATSPDARRPPYPPPHPPSGPRPLPPEPIIGGVLTSLIFAALLAWYFARPIRNLRDAFAAAAKGDLDHRVGPLTGRRRDELADLGRDFDRMAEQLRALIDGQRRLLHDVSHELRSPLARMQAAIGLAHQQPQQWLESMARIEQESMRMDRLVGELLTLSRMEAGVTSDMAQETDFDELLEQVVADGSFEAEATGRKIGLENKGAGVGHGNPELLHRALENVVRNALRHASAKVSIDARRTEDGSLLIAICDDGPGVPEQELPRIFEPFFRGSQSRSNDGHGLGLAIARQVMTAHGGQVRANNRPTGGLCVKFLLPPV